MLHAVLTWYRSLYSTSGTLDLGGYIYRLVAAFAVFLGIGFLGLILAAPVMGLLIALQASTWTAWLPMLIMLPLFLLAMVSWAAILIASTIRFVRHLMAASQGEPRS